MNIGEITLQDGRLKGQIATRSIDLPQIGLRPVQSQNQRAPAYEIVARNVADRWVQIGALWPQVSNSSGEEFLQGSIDDPSLPEPLPIALFGNTTEGYRVAWRRPQRRDDFGTATRDAGGTAEGDGGGFGPSTAGNDGSFNGAGMGSDEDWSR